jgi:hypothetical protein
MVFIAFLSIVRLTPWTLVFIKGGKAYKAQYLQLPEFTAAVMKVFLQRELR